MGRRLKRKLHILEMRIQKFKVEVPGRGGGVSDCMIVLLVL